MADNVSVTAGSGTTIAADELTDGTLGVVKVQYVKLMDGTLDSSNKALINSAGEIAFYGPDGVASGTITTTDVVVAAPAGAGALVTGASTAGSLVSLLSAGGDSAWIIQITALTSGTLYFEGSVDSTNGTDGNWINVNGRRAGVLISSITGNATANGIWRGNTAGLKYFRVRSVGALTGTPAIIIRFGDGAGAVFLNSLIPVQDQSAASIAPIGSVSLGTTLGKTIQKALGSVATTATTADQVIATVPTTTGKTFFITHFDVMVWLTTPAATFTNFGTVSLELPSGTKVWTQQLQGPGVDRIVVPVFEALFGTTTQVVRLVVTPAAATAMTWRGNILGDEK